MDELRIFIPNRMGRIYAVREKDVRFELMRTLLAIAPENRASFFEELRRKFPNGVINTRTIRGSLNDHDQRGTFNQ